MQIQNQVINPTDYLLSEPITYGVAGVVVGVTLLSLVLIWNRFRVKNQIDQIRLSSLFEPTIGADSWDPSKIWIPHNGTYSMTDEELVLRILITYDGRINQSHLVDKTGWSKSKVSRILSRMESTGDITRVTVGRENLVFLGSFQRKGEQAHSPI